MTNAISRMGKAVPAIAPSAGGAGTMTPIEVDCAGYDRVIYMCLLGTATTSGLFDTKVQDSATSGGALADITGAALTQVTKAAGDNTVQLIDVPINPARPFHKLVTVTTTAAFPNGVVAFLYKGSGYFPKTVTPQVVVL